MSLDALLDRQVDAEKLTLLAALLNTSPQIQREALQAFYGKNKFGIKLYTIQGLYGQLVLSDKLCCLAISQRFRYVRDLSVNISLDLSMLKAWDAGVITDFLTQTSCDFTILSIHFIHSTMYSSVSEPGLILANIFTKNGMKRRDQLLKTLCAVTVRKLLDLSFEDKVGHVMSDLRSFVQQVAARKGWKYERREQVGKKIDDTDFYGDPLWIGRRWVGWRLQSNLYR